MFGMLLYPLIQLIIAYKVMRFGIALVVASSFYLLVDAIFTYFLSYASDQLSAVSLPPMFVYMATEFGVNHAISLYVSIVFSYKVSIMSIKILERQVSRI